MVRFNFSCVSIITVNFWIYFTFTNCYWCRYYLMWMNRSTAKATPTRVEGR
jgi:hypothetical protein